MTKKEILAALTSVRGIGPTLAERVWKAFRDGTVEALINRPEEVAEQVRGISLARATAARKAILSAQLAAEPLERAERPPQRRSRRDRAETVREKTATDSDAAFGSGLEGPQTTVPAHDGLLDKDSVRQRLGKCWREAFERRRHVESVFERHANDLIQRPDVEGVHVGFRRRRSADGRAMITDDLEYCICIDVEKKLEPGHRRFADPRLGALLPKEIEGVRVDVVERKYATFVEEETTAVAVEEAPAVEQRVGPREYHPTLKGGIAIARENMPSNEGTLGALVFSGFDTRLITNHHVVGGPGNRVQQPPSGQVPDGATAFIGTVIDAELPSAALPSSIDCAIVAIESSRPQSVTVGDLDPNSVFVIGTLTAPDVHKTRAFKIGAFTGRTEGIVKSIDTVVSLNGSVMPRQIIVESEDGSQIITGGDSGSLLLVQAANENAFRVVGLVHARSTDGTAMVATHFHEIANRFGVSPNILF